MARHKAKNSSDRKVDKLARGKGSVAYKIRQDRDRKQTFLNEIMKEFSGQGMGPAGKSSSGSS